MAASSSQFTSSALKGVLFLFSFIFVKILIGLYCFIRPYWLTLRLEERLLPWLSVCLFLLASATTLRCVALRSRSGFPL